MRAMVIDRFGGADELHLRDLPSPVAGQGMVLIRVKAAAVNPVDAGGLSGIVFPSERQTFPMLLGWDVAGVVTAIGEGVTRLAVGDRVMATMPPGFGFGGGYAEERALPERVVAKSPATATDVEAAGLPLSGLTALQAIDLLDLKAGQVLLINGAVGGVGGLAVQIAAKRDIKVVAIVSCGDADAARRLGASKVIDRNGDVWNSALTTVPGGVDAALDMVGGAAAHAAFGAIRDGGLYATTAPDWWRPGGVFAPARGITPQIVRVRPDAEDLARLAAMVDAGELILRTAETFPLQRAADANERLARGGVRGKLVLVM